jgi:hypothetical protein
MGQSRRGDSQSMGESMVMSRRVIGHSVLAVILGSAWAWAQAPSTPTPAAGTAAQAPARGQAPEPARGGRGGGRGPAQGGTGPLKVMFVSRGHPFDREGLFSTLDALGTDITWTHVEQPAAELYLDPKNAGPYDVLLFYDLDGSQPDRKHTVTGPDGTPKSTWDAPPVELQKSFKALLQSGKGIVFLHHALASWVHAWPEYVEAMGGACDWFAPLGTIRSLDYPRSGAFGRTKQHVTVVDKTHPIVQGLGDGFDIVDEAYSCPMDVRGVGAPAASHRFHSCRSRSESESQDAVQQLIRVGEDGGEQSDRLYSARPRLDGVGEPAVPAAAAECLEVGGVARSQGLGEGASHKDLQMNDLQITDARKPSDVEEDFDARRRLC